LQNNVYSFFLDVSQCADVVIGDNVGSSPKQNMRPQVMTDRYRQLLKLIMAMN